MWRSIMCVLVLPLSARAAEPLTLADAVRAALLHNERAGIARADVEVAAAGVQRARAAFLPNLTASATYAYAFDAATRALVDPWSGIASADLTVLDARSFPLYRYAQLLEDAAVESETQARLELAFDVADSYLTVLTAEQFSQAAARRLELAKLGFEEAEARKRVGLASGNDVTQAELEMATAERELTRARGDEVVTRLGLRNLTGLETLEALVMPERLLELAEPTELHPDRPDLTASRLRADAAAALALEPWLRLVPRVGVFVQARLFGGDGGIVPLERETAAGVRLTWVLFDAGLFLADRNERLARAEIADLESRALSRQLDLEVQTALAALRSSEAAVKQAGVAVAAAQRNAAEARELYRQGLTRALEVTDAGVRLFEAEVALARERFGRGLAALQLRAALGQPPVDGLAELGNKEE